MLGNPEFQIFVRQAITLFDKRAGVANLKAPRRCGELRDRIGQV